MFFIIKLLTCNVQSPIFINMSNIMHKQKKVLFDGFLLDRLMAKKQMYLPYT